MADYVDTRISGIPCKVRVDRVEIVPPWTGSSINCPSADDYYGYSEVEFTVCDRRGRVAPWLERKMTGSDYERIESEILTIG